MDHLACPRCHNSNPSKISLVETILFSLLAVFGEEFLLCENCYNIYKVEE